MNIRRGGGVGDKDDAAKGWKPVIKREAEKRGRLRALSQPLGAANTGEVGLWVPPMREEFAAAGKHATRWVRN